MVLFFLVDLAFSATWWVSSTLVTLLWKGGKRLAIGPPPPDSTADLQKVREEIAELKRSLKFKKIDAES